MAAAAQPPFAKKLFAVIPDALQRFFTDQCPQQAAAIAYRVLFSIAPLAIVLVSVFGLVLQHDAVREDVVDAIVDALPVTVAGRPLRSWRYDPATGVLRATFRLRSGTLAVR